MSDETTSEEIRTDAVMQEMFAVLHGQEMPLLTRWSYRADDPYAVMMSISRPNGRWIEWLLARDLLVEGMLTPSGMGDVRVAPFTDEEFDIVEVKIGDDEGFASLEFDRELMERFLAATYEVVALGAEADVIDVAAEIEKITNSCAG
ncbi:MAG: SsgA family sporulation/cell division regulator [Pseudonocardia sp.]